MRMIVLTVPDEVEPVMKRISSVAASKVIDDADVKIFLLGTLAAVFDSYGDAEFARKLVQLNVEDVLQ